MSEENTNQEPTIDEQIKELEDQLSALKLKKEPKFSVYFQDGAPDCDFFIDHLTLQCLVIDKTAAEWAKVFQNVPEVADAMIKARGE